jgi:hypothetical protein
MLSSSIHPLNNKTTNNCLSSYLSAQQLLEPNNAGKALFKLAWHHSTDSCADKKRRAQTDRNGGCERASYAFFHIDILATSISALAVDANEKEPTHGVLAP